MGKQENEVIWEEIIIASSLTTRYEHRQEKDMKETQAGEKKTKKMNVWKILFRVLILSFIPPPRTPV